MLRSIYLLFCSLFLSLLFSCSHNPTPVDELVDKLDLAIEKTKNVNSFSQLVNDQNIVSADEVWNIIKENPNYKLTEKDKEKLKKSYNKLLDTSYDKTCEFVTDEKLKTRVKNELSLFKDAMNLTIDHANTLGEIRDFN